MKKFLIVFVVMLLALTGCGNSTEEREADEPAEATETPSPSPTDEPTPTPDTRIEIPDVTEVDFESAKTILLGKGLLVTSEEVYSDEVAEGIVVGTDPEIGSKVDESSKVKVYISKGPAFVSSYQCTYQWYSIGYEKDEWAILYTPYIHEDYLYIVCKPVFGTSFVLKDTGFGIASLTDTFDKYVPIELLDENGETFEEMHQVQAGEEFDFTIKIPIRQLDASRPTQIVCSIRILVDGVEQDETVTFNMAWEE